MKLYFILGVLFVGINGEKKINLEDIERDNLRVEGISKSGIGRPQETKYLAKPEINQQQYQIPSQYSRPTSSPVTYVTPPSSQNHVPPESYAQYNKYTTREQVYQQQNSILPEQPLQQYYIDYQQQKQPPPQRLIGPNVYEPQQFIYRPEVTVGNQLQTTQQKTVTAKYAKNKETVYVDVPMMHVLTYYPNLDVNPGKSSVLVPRLTTSAADQISIPLYSSLNQKPIVSAKPTYQLQYPSKYNAVGPAATATKAIKSTTVYATPVTPKKYTNAPLVNVPTYFPSDQSYNQGRQFLYTQAYIAQPQSQYVPQLVYTQPTMVYMHATPVYTDVYARAPAYAQDNSLPANGKYSAPPEQLDTATTIADQLPNHVQQASQSLSLNYVKDPEEPNDNLVPPQLPAQDFKSDVTPLSPVQSQDEESTPAQNHVDLSEPRSLLDSYVPSNLIAAQDFARYQERPIKLESGFLPSKENFLHKKRKTN
ncbi:uncharacterized protein LOC128886473 [Hylaeus anthracinus]|uniref:uncharacterized protein LOC128886473 n=1 Tax=Hylaeus anthracinus TaxID=313031 RepID=UPI0023B9EE78|nr:uncharacterized protein LOC128886473 [Hylaeus anthracinus]